jgi:colicin import membrane protein
VRETRADTAQALLLALLLHALLFGLVLFGLWWTREPETVSAAGSPVQAELVDANALPASMQRALQAPTEAPTPPPPEPPIPEPQPEPESTPPPQPEAQLPVPVPDDIEQAKVDRDALAAETAAREQEAKHRQEQIDLTERQRQEEVENAKRLAALEQQRRQQLADIRKQRAAAAKAADLAEQKLKQIADARANNAAEAAARADAAASAPAGNNGADTDLRARYAAALQQAIAQNWTRPESVPLGQRCKLTIHQLPGGTLVPGREVEIDPSCPYDDAGKRSIEAAVLKAQPLPYAGFEKVFVRNPTVNFEAQDR